MAISPCTVQSCYNTTTKTRGTAGGLYGYNGQGLAPHKEAYNPMPIHMSDGLCEASSGLIWFFPCVQPHFTFCCISRGENTLYIWHANGKCLTQNSPPFLLIFVMHNHGCGNFFWAMKYQDIIGTTLPAAMANKKKVVWDGSYLPSLL